MSSCIPSELHRSGRGIDPNFTNDEDLYLRFKYILNNIPSPSEIRCPDQSVNRSKYCSRPEWVLLPTFQDYGYGSLKVRDVPARLVSAGGVGYNFRPEHAPEEENYSHTEIRAYRESDSKRIKKIKGNKRLKMEFRMQICESVIILRYPSEE